MKFDSARDEILSVMANEGWANQSSGDVESPVGWFARISNDESEIISIVDAFEQEIFEIDSDFDFSTLAGHFLLREDSQGFFYVETFPTAAALVRAYNERERAYSDWLDED